MGGHTRKGEVMLVEQIVDLLASAKVATDVQVWVGNRRVSSGKLITERDAMSKEETHRLVLEVEPDSTSG